MSDSTITWNGVSSDTLGLKIEKYPALNRPARKYTAADIPGQNGTAYILQDAWSETVQAYEISVKEPISSFKAIAEWLHGANGYAKLSDSYDPDIYRMAVVVDPFDVENSLNKAGRAMIQFRCRPERYIVQNDVTISPQSGTVSNSSIHTAYPLIKIVGQGNPSMLRTTSRSDRTPSLSSSSKITYLTSVNGWYNYIGMNVESNRPVVNNDSTKISSYSFATGSVTLTNTTAGYGIGMNIKVQPNTDYNVSFLCSGSGITGYFSVVLTDKNGNISSAFRKTFSSGSTRQSLAFTTESDTYWAVLVFARDSSAGSITYSNIQMNLGSTAMSYAAYTADTSSVFSVSNTLGTVYVHLSELYDYMYLDCETLNAYREPGENLSPNVSFTDADGNPTAAVPTLAPSPGAGSLATTFYLRNTDRNWISSLVVTPRTWTL